MPRGLFSRTRKPKQQPSNEAQPLNDMQEKLRKEEKEWEEASKHFVIMEAVISGQDRLEDDGRKSARTALDGLDVNPDFLLFNMSELVYSVWPTNNRTAKKDLLSAVKIVVTEIGNILGAYKSGSGVEGVKAQVNDSIQKIRTAHNELHSKLAHQGLT